MITDQPTRWEVLALYDRRFWIEASFRADKSGWGWEHSQVQGVERHAVLLLAMAWATVLTLLVGAQVAADHLARLVPPPAGQRPAKPTRAKFSLFTLGLRALIRWLLHPSAPPLPLCLPDLLAPAWLH